MRKIRYKLDKLGIMIKEELDNVINEVYDSPIPTEYVFLNKIDEQGFNYTIYRFKTTLGNSYDLDFVYSILTPKRTIIDGTNDDLSLVLKSGNEYMEYVDLGFTPTEVNEIDIDDDIVGTMDDPYINKTNRNENYELLNRITYLVREFMKNNGNVVVYSIGKNTHKNNLAQYIYIFKKIFSNDFTMFDIKNPDYKYGSYFFINNNNLK